MFPICISSCSSSLHGILPLDSDNGSFPSVFGSSLFSRQHSIFRMRYNVYQELRVSLCPWRAASLQRNWNNIRKTTQYCRRWLTAPKPSKTSDGYCFNTNTNSISFSDFKRARISFVYLDLPWLAKNGIKCL